MINHINNVRKFMLGIGQDCPNAPTLRDQNTRKLRARLILEEALEAVEALGFDVFTNEYVKSQHIDNIDDLQLFPNNKEDLSNIMKELCDLSVVGVAGTSIALGIDAEPFLEAVDENNLLKIKNGKKCPKTGKWIKNPDHPKPDMESILASQV